MAYDKDREKLVKIGAEYHSKLEQLAAAQKRNMRSTLEILIEEAWNTKPVDGPEIEDK